MIIRFSNLTCNSIFIEIFLPKSKPILAGVHYWNIIKSNISNFQECYLMGGFNINLLSGKKMLLKKQYSDSYSQTPSILKKYIDLCFFHFFYQSIMEPTRATEHSTYRSHSNELSRKSHSEWCYWNRIFWSWNYLLFKKNVTFRTKWVLRNFTYVNKKIEIFQMKFLWIN